MGSGPECVIRLLAHGWPAGGWASDNVTAEVVPGAQHFFRRVLTGVSNPQERVIRCHAAPMAEPELASATYPARILFPILGWARL